MKNINNIKKRKKLLEFHNLFLVSSKKKYVGIYHNFNINKKLKLNILSTDVFLCAWKKKKVSKLNENSVYPKNNLLKLLSVFNLHNIFVGSIRLVILNSVFSINEKSTISGSSLIVLYQNNFFFEIPLLNKIKKGFDNLMIYHFINLIYFNLFNLLYYIKLINLK
uniref:Uncharacterized protein orf164 n=1 Tax=Glaucocystis nostochinearum TaxID=38271 RepID=E9P6D3_9EUKA|nr:hypothetical protein GlnoM_p17 [Glaucocystis nostochinearum]ADW83117.1 hypothetical protein [Glaucocystis nostochinearum]